MWGLETLYLAFALLREETEVHSPPLPPQGRASTEQASFAGIDAHQNRLLVRLL